MRCVSAPSGSPYPHRHGSPAAAAAGKSLRDGGIDVLYCSHRDGSLSVWQRHPRLLTYSCLGASKLLPPAPKFGTGGHAVEGCRAVLSTARWFFGLRRGVEGCRATLAVHRGAWQRGVPVAAS